MSVHIVNIYVNIHVVVWYVDCGCFGGRKATTMLEEIFQVEQLEPVTTSHCQVCVTGLPTEFFIHFHHHVVCMCVVASPFTVHRQMVLE